ncbi:MAG: CHASE2 domain-containing protein [Rhodospirillaceae bacterium]|nr:CHASE2 domain-containing protein [Rhodospirillaceae bacterium]
MANARPRRAWFAAAFALVAVLAAYLVSDAVVLLRNIEAEALDHRFRLRGPIKPGDETAIVLLDDRTLLELGRLPIDREWYARAIDRLAADGARVIGLDVLMVEPGPEEADRAVARALARAGETATVIPFALVRDRSEGVGGPMPGHMVRHAFRRVFSVDTTEVSLPIDGYLATVPEIAAAASHSGHVTILHDTDGGLRHELAALAYGSAIFPSLPISATAAYLGVSWSELTIFSGRELWLGDRVLPLDRANRMLVNFLGPPGIVPTYSFVDLINGRTPPGTFKDKIVLIGGSAIGIRDFHRSPFGERLTGVERYATIIDNILSQRYVVRPPWASTVDIAVILVVGGLAALAAGRLQPSRAAIAILALLASTLVGNYAAFEIWGVWLNLLHPVLAIAIEAAVVGTACYVVVERARRAADLALAAQQERYRLAAAGSRDGIWDWNLVDDSFYASPRMAELMGFDPGEEITEASAFLGLIYTDDRLRLEHAIARHLAGEVAQIHEEFRLVEHPESWRLIRGVAFDGRRRLAGSLTDLSERRWQTARLELLARDLDKAKAEAERANHVKSMFLARMSHELRTPLNAMLGFTELMVGEAFGPIKPDRYARYVGDIHASAKHLLALVTDILDLSKIDEGGFQLAEQVVSLREASQEVASLLSQQTDAKNLKLTVFALDRVQVTADARAVRQILLNLVANAIKFTPPGGSIEIEIGIDSLKRARLAVRDTGVGIAVVDLPKITRAYSQVRRDDDAAQAGTGLGLAIVAALVDLHGGTFGIDSKPGEGTVATVLFPAARLIRTVP